MSKIEFRPRGGMDGISTTYEEQNKLADVLGSKAIDEFIPVPNVSMEEQKTRVKYCIDHDANVEYWENEKGRHGWCCKHCGTVVQWG